MVEKTKKTLVLDIGTSQCKGVLVNGATLTWACFDTLGLLTDLNGTVSTGLRLPMQGLYGKPAKESGAELLRNPDIYSNPMFKFLLFALTADLLEPLPIWDTDITVDVVIGFPVNHISRAEEIATYLTSQPWPIERVGGIQRTVTIQNVLFKVQPYFAIIDQLFALQKGQLTPRRELLANGAILVLHIGSNTVDFFYAPQSLINCLSGGVMKGTFNLLDRLGALAYAKTHRNVPLYELMYEVFKTGSYQSGKLMFDFSQELPGLVHTWIQDHVAPSLDLFLAKLPSEPYAMLLVGGGVIYAEPFLREEYDVKFKGGVVVTKDDDGRPESVFSVPRGMVKYALYRQMKEAARDEQTAR